MPGKRQPEVTSPDPSADFAERRIDGEWVYRGVLLHVRRDRVRLSTGVESVREYIDHPGAAAVIALLDDGAVLMERQHRYPLGRDFYELPAGKIDPGEDALVTAQRELLEETGWVASTWRHVTTIHPVVAYCNERIELFLATGLSHQGVAPDIHEPMEVSRLSVATGLEWVRDGRITDAKTMIGLFWADRILRGDWLPDAGR
ncbi:MAG: NUDIX hydrolase [Burkholderiales bacterium]|nr:NUDIX hydrolase [Burkholderiales bacterium]